MDVVDQLGLLLVTSWRDHSLHKKGLPRTSPPLEKGRSTSGAGVDAKPRKRRVRVRVER